ncbi:MAG TPA: hypothetical protein VMV37_01280 [Gammaproteobacteria bacterium]|nr:hypothetical protein [Gammaproteobacteria bacterium]
MTFNPDTTSTTAEFKRPLLDPNEERLARELQRDSDLRVDGLRYSLLGRILSLFGAKR